jgi:hypothetical protein
MALVSDNSPSRTKTILFRFHALNEEAKVIL